MTKEEMIKEERIAIRSKAIEKMLALFPEAAYLSNDVEWELLKALIDGKAQTADEAVEVVKPMVDVIEITAEGTTRKVVYMPSGPSSNFITVY